MPYYPSSDNAGKHGYHITSWWLRLVAEYARMSIPDVRKMDYLRYLIWRRDAYIYMLSRTEEGQKYLDNAWRLEQTSPDRGHLRSKFNNH